MLVVPQLYFVSYVWLNPTHRTSGGIYNICDLHVLTVEFDITSKLVTSVSSHRSCKASLWQNS